MTNILIGLFDHRACFTFYEATGPSLLVLECLNLTTSHLLFFEPWTIIRFTFFHFRKYSKTFLRSLSLAMTKTSRYSMVSFRRKVIIPLGWGF